MYKNLIELFKENEGKGAVGAFNLHCFEMLPAMIQAAEELYVPIIIQTSLGTAECMMDLHYQLKKISKIHKKL